MNGYDDEEDDDHGAGGDWESPKDGRESSGESTSDNSSFCPEENPFVEPILGDLRLREAMAKGEYARFRGILEYYRGQADDPDEVAAIDYAYFNPQLFVDPVEKTPRMFTFNGFGTRLYGRKDLDRATGFRVATLWLTMLFVPIFPIRRYLVRSEDEKNFEFYARYGASVGQNLWRVMLGAGVVGMALLSVLIFAFVTMTHEPEVQIINAFDEPVEIVVDGEESFEVGPRSMKSKSIEEGRRHFSTHFVDGIDIEELDFEVPARKDLVVYNVAGAAPAIVESITYFNMDRSEYQSGAYLDHLEDYELLAGQHHYVRDDVQYIDVDPPEELDLIVGDRSVRWALYYEQLAHDWTYEDWDGDDAWADEYGLDDFHRDDEDLDDLYDYYLSPESALDQLYTDDSERFEELLVRLIRLQPTETWHQYWVRDKLSDASYSGDREEGQKWMALLDEVLGEHPEALELHLFLIQMKDLYAVELGRQPALERYRDHHDEHDSAKSAYLLSYILHDQQEVQPLLERILEERDSAPDSLISAAQRGLAKIEYLNGDCDEAVEFYEASLHLDDGLFFNDYRSYMKCLAEQERYEDGRSFLRRARELDGDSDQFLLFEPAEIYGRLILSDPTSDDDPFAMARDDYRDLYYAEIDGSSYVRYANAMGIAVDADEVRAMGVEEFADDLLRVNEVLYHRPHELMDALRFSPTPFVWGGPEVGLLATLLAASQGDYSLFDTYAAYYEEPGSEEEEVRQRMRQATHGFRFDGAPPDDWASDKQVVYYLAQAYLTDDESERRQHIDEAQERTRLWGPLDAIAKGLLEDLR